MEPLNEGSAGAGSGCHNPGTTQGGRDLLPQKSVSEKEALLLCLCVEHWGGGAVRMSRE